MPDLRLCRLVSKLPLLPVAPHGHRRRRPGAIPPASVILMLRTLHRCSVHACMCCHMQTAVMLMFQELLTASGTHPA